MDKITNIFSYGNIIVPSMTEQFFGPREFVPLKSVFIKGFKIKIRHANSKKYPNYHCLLAEYTGNDMDIIPGFLVEVYGEDILDVDEWEGNSYERVNILCYDKDINKIDCQIYKQK